MCNKEESFPDLKTAWICGWDIGKNATCWECRNTDKPNTTQFNPDYISELIAV